jgi:hypothetical protein
LAGSYLGQHEIAATDFFSVEVVTARGLVRYCVLVVIDITTRRVDIARICHDPYQAWVSNALRAAGSGRRVF